MKKELIRQKYLEEKNFSNLRIETTLEHGYYKNSPEKKYIQINLKYKCKDKTDSCIHNILTKQDDYYTLFVWVECGRLSTAGNKKTTLTSRSFITWCGLRESASLCSAFRWGVASEI